MLVLEGDGHGFDGCRVEAAIISGYHILDWIPDE